MTDVKLQVYFWMVILMLIAATVGITGLYADELYIDEAISAIHVHYEGWNNPLEVAQSLQRNSPDHVPGYFTLLMVWARLTALDPGILRYFSVIWGVLALAMTYRLGVSLHSPALGLIASGLIGLSGLFLYYTHELRMYTLQIAVIAFETWLYWKIINRKSPPVIWYQWLGLTIGSILLIYIHYFSIFPLIGLGVYHLLFVKKDRRWVGVAVSMAIAGASLLPWLWVQRHALASHYTLDGAITTGQVITYTLSLFANGFPFLLLLMVPGFVIRLRDRNRSLVFALTIALGAAVSFFLVHEFVSSLVAYRRARYVLVLWPYLALVSAISLFWLIRWRWLLLLVMAGWAVTAGVYLMSPELPLQTNRIDDMDVHWYPPIYTISRQVDGLATEDTPIWLVDLNDPDTLLKVPDRVWLFYSNWTGAPVRYLRDREFEHDLEVSGYDDTVNGVWFVHSPQHAYPAIEAFLDEEYTVCDTVLDGDGYLISYYVRDVDACRILDR